MSDFIDWVLFMIAFEELVGEVEYEGGLENADIGIGMYDTWRDCDECWLFDDKLMAVIERGGGWS